ncbi:MAG: T9SS type A sorting domain-containing protein [Bacteroidota bacterium]
MKKFTLLSFALLGCLALNAQLVTYTDNFSDDHDYLTQGVEGTIWQGYKVNDSGNTTADPINDTEVLDFKAVDGALLIYSNMGNFEHVLDDGAYIYRVVPGGIDFEVSVKIVDGYFTSFQDSVSYYNSAGIIVRNPDNASQNNLYFMWFDVPDWNIHSMLKNNVDGGQTELVNSRETYPSLTAYPWMKAKRVGNVFTMSLSPDGFTWTDVQTAERADLEGIDLEVGLTQCNFWSDVAHSATLDNFSLTHPWPEGIDADMLSKQFKAYSYNGKLIMQADANISSSAVYSIDGRQVAAMNNVDDNRCEFNNLKAGVYIAVANVDGQRTARKVIVQ